MSTGSSGLGLRKGAWTAQEDLLLKNCIEKYGEGKWHLIPLRSGLNRCRKSCRLRWLNYLQPNIKKGNFAEDEVDLIFRLHKLLGNRWSLIAGRIPGRTANDIKNYWNSHIQSRSKQHNKEHTADESREDATVSIVKPHPHSISKTINLYMSDNKKIVPNDGGNLIRSSNEGANNSFHVSSLPLNVLDDKIIAQYLDELSDDRSMEIDGVIGWSFGETLAQVEALNVVDQEDGNNNFFDFSVDDEVMWNPMNSEQL